MRITELIKTLEVALAVEGDVEVCVCDRHANWQFIDTTNVELAEYNGEPVLCIDL